MWTIDLSCREQIDECWNKTFVGTKMSRIKNNINKLTQNLTNWNRHTFGNFKKQLVENKRKLETLYNFNLNEQIMSEIAQTKKLIEDLERKEEIFLAQKSRINWLKYGDKNSKFFHISTITRKQHNRITTIQNQNGE